MTTTMIVVWAAVMAFTLLLEFFTVDFFASCFSVGALVALILAACGANVYWQVGVFFGFRCLLEMLNVLGYAFVYTYKTIDIACKFVW